LKGDKVRVKSWGNILLCPPFKRGTNVLIKNNICKEENDIVSLSKRESERDFYTYPQPLTQSLPPGKRRL
jgi:hypothetical protein